MKENEEITNLERFELLIEDCKGHRELYGEFSVGEYDIEIMKHILSDYKRVLKENEERTVILLSGAEKVKQLEKENEELMKLMVHKNIYTKKLEEDLFENASNYVIPKQKLKDKIKELSKTKGDLATYIEVSERIRALQELLEESEEN